MSVRNICEAYFHAATAHDVDRAISCFAVDAIVHDEGRIHEGQAAISEWMKATNIKYQTRYDVISIDVNDEKALAVSKISGTFPGSPIELKFELAVRDEKIVLLKCGV